MRGGRTSLRLLAVLAALPTLHAAPALKITLSGTNAVLSWPATNNYFYLEQATGLLSTVAWSPISARFYTLGAQLQVTQSVSQTRFFRLAALTAVYVAPPPFGNDANPGTTQAPLATIGAGIALAAIPKVPVNVAAGTYTQAVTLVSGVSLYGLYDGTTNWTRGQSNTTAIQAGSVAVDGSLITTETHIDGFLITAANATNSGGSSYGIRIANSSNVFISNNTIKSGNGAAGLAGMLGTAGLAGTNGTIGGGGACGAHVLASGGPGGGSACGSAGGMGGSGGYALGAGGQGGPGVGSGGGAGGAGGSLGSPGTNGTSGTSLCRTKWVGSRSTRSRVVKRLLASRWRFRR